MRLCWMGADGAPTRRHRFQPFPQHLPFIFPHAVVVRLLARVLLRLGLQRNVLGVQQRAEGGEAAGSRADGLEDARAAGGVDAAQRLLSVSCTPGRPQPCAAHPPHLPLGLRKRRLQHVVSGPTGHAHVAPGCAWSVEEGGRRAGTGGDSAVGGRRSAAGQGGALRAQQPARSLTEAAGVVSQVRLVRDWLLAVAGRHARLLACLLDERAVERRARLQEAVAER